MRGPASAVWGANALTGVVNIITKTPREAVGEQPDPDRAASSTATTGSERRTATATAYGAATSASPGRRTRRMSWKLSAGYFNSDPFSRPAGTVPGSAHPLGAIPCGRQGRRSRHATGGAPYPADSAQGTPGTHFREPRHQPAEGRPARRPGVQRRRPPDLQRRLRRHRRASSTPGIGPFDIQSGSYMAYGKRDYSKGALKVSGFAQLPRRRRARTCCSPTRRRCQPVPAQLQDPDLRLRDRALDGPGRQAHPELRRQRAPQQLRHHAHAERRGPQRVRRLLPGRDLLRQVPLHAGRPRGQVREPRQRRLLAAHHRDVQAHAGPLASGSRSTGPSARRRSINNYLDQNIFLADARRPAAARAPGRRLAPRLVPALSQPFPLIVRNVGNTGT